jgi:CheY-like chemotaxis protein
MPGPTHSPALEDEDSGALPILVPPRDVPLGGQPRLMVRPVILAVDDDPAVLNLLAQTFAQELPDVALREAGSAREGEQAALSWTPHVIICDIHLPDEDGRHLLARLRRHPSLAGVPAILMTGLDISTGILREEASALHAQLLRKPFELPDLLRLVGRGLAQRGAVETDSR